MHKIRSYSKVRKIFGEWLMIFMNHVELGSLSRGMSLASHVFLYSFLFILIPELSPTIHFSSSSALTIRISLDSSLATRLSTFLTCFPQVPHPSTLHHRWRCFFGISVEFPVYGKELDNWTVQIDGWGLFARIKQIRDDIIADGTETLCVLAVCRPRIVSEVWTGEWNRQPCL